MKRFQFNFEEIDYENPVHDSPMRSELSVHLSDDARWDEVINFFAAFLESVGYVSVRERLANLGVFDLGDALDFGDDEDVLKALEKYETPRNS